MHSAIDGSLEFIVTWNSDIYFSWKLQVVKCTLLAVVELQLLGAFTITCLITATATYLGQGSS